MTAMSLCVIEEADVGWLCSEFSERSKSPKDFGYFAGQVCSSCPGRPSLSENSKYAATAQLCRFRLCQMDFAIAGSVDINFQLNFGQVADKSAGVMLNKDQRVW